MDYLILKDIQITNANAISGVTYGFPAISHFLGFVHALSRKAQQSEFHFSMQGCGIVCHDHQVHAHRDNQFEPYVFALTRNPLTKEGKTAPIVEEGRMQLRLSLVIACEGMNLVIDERTKALSQWVKDIAFTQKLAGGTITNIGACFVSKDKDLSLLRKLLPGFILIDRSDYLDQLNTKQPQKTLENWLSFSALQWQATEQPLLEKVTNEKLSDDTAPKDEPKKVKWEYIKRDFTGYLVPLQVGYKKITPTFAANEVQNTRDPDTPLSFVEPIFSIAEWIGSPSRLKSLEQVIWHYQYQDPFYLCKTQSQLDEEISIEDFTDEDFANAFE